MYRQCPKRFRLKYIDGDGGKTDTDATRFGTACHRALEEEFGRFVLTGEGGSPDAARLKDGFAKAFADEGLTDQDLFMTGMGVMERFAAAHGSVAPGQVVGVELPFRLELGRHTVVGFIDRLDRIGPGEYVVTDYKTNRQPYETEELETSMQLSLYDWAVRKMFPDAEVVHLRYWMLRMGYVQMAPERDAATLERHMEYFRTLCDGTEGGEYPARVNGLCAWCDSCSVCREFQDLCRGDSTPLKTYGDGTQPDAVAAILEEREVMAAVERYGKKRKEAADSYLKEAVKCCPEGESIHGGGRKAVLIRRTTVKHGAQDVFDILSANGVPVVDLLGKVLSVKNTDLNGYISKKLVPDLGRMKAMEIEAELDSRATTSTSLSVSVVEDA
ncbi:MAG: PD-(D/E)XK nuclease family protein [Akkermansia sp.]|nr:PD-(D/E)XK nuclease family protein [Akkermansia sp.]